MPRFFFDVHDGRDVRDDNGMDLATLQEARREALGLASTMLLTETAKKWKGEMWHVVVHAGDRSHLFTLSFVARPGASA